MTTKVEHVKLLSNKESFTRGTYNGISVIIRDKDNYINATAMCNQFGKRFRKIFENHAWQEYLEEFKEEYDIAQNGAMCQYMLRKGYLKKITGTYIHPKLINYVAIWASPKYAVKVGKIMDSINGLIHVELQKNKLPDTPTNSIPILKKIEKSLRQQLSDQMDTIDDKDSYAYRDLQANVDALDENDKFNIVLYEKSMRDSSDKMF
jgi:hypothetical protein